MKKETKKEKNTNEPIYHSIDRVLLLTFPMALALLILMLAGQLAPFAALIAFLITFVLTFILALPFLRELEILIHYLKQEAEGKTDIETPRFAKKRREAFKIAQFFNEIKMSWLIKNKILEAQSLTDGAILEGLPDPLLMLNNAGDIVEANLSARQYLGGGIIFKNITEPLNAPVFLAALKKIQENQEQNTAVEFSFKKKKAVYVNALVQRLPAPTKTGAEIVVVLHDITDLKLFEKSQTAFFANASHELKTPLSVLSGFIETLQGPAKDDTRAREKFLKIMAEQTTHMTELVQDLLALSRLQLNEEMPKDDTILVAETIKSVFQTLNLKAKSHQNKLVLTVIHEPPPFKGRSADIARVFQNLIDNAIKYGKKRSPITVTVSLEALPPPEGSSLPVQEIVVKVHNKGNPIDPEDLPRLSERFYRIANDPNISGTGLGLSIAFEIIHQYDGQIDITSSAQEGTTFTVRWPVLL